MNKQHDNIESYSIPHHRSYLEWCENELSFLHTGCDIDKAMHKHLMHMCKEFAEEHHSGFSAAYAANLLDRLFRWLPILPLTGGENEWVKVDDNCYQNIRCSRVFKDKDGAAYDIKGKIFKDKEGYTYISKDSRVYITFPYVPKSEIVER